MFPHLNYYLLEAVLATVTTLSLQSVSVSFAYLDTGIFCCKITQKLDQA